MNYEGWWRWILGVGNLIKNSIHHIRRLCLGEGGWGGGGMETGKYVDKFNWGEWVKNH